MPILEESYFGTPHLIKSVDERDLRSLHETHYLKGKMRCTWEIWMCNQMTAKAISCFVSPVLACHVEEILDFPFCVSKINKYLASCLVLEHY